MAAEQIEKFAAGVGTRFERGGKFRDPVVVVDEFLFAGERVVDAIDAIFGQRIADRKAGG